jgi:alkylation response protein AidB-like acyl-CoA dehydrogenase
MIEPSPTDTVDLGTFASSFESWLRSCPPELTAAAAPSASSDGGMKAMSALMRALHDEGWSRHGWPEAVGGLGGSVLHRAAMWEGLARHGVSKMAAFEHLEILGPTLIQMGPAGFVTEHFPRFLDGQELWCQGFSEPDAGSDLASLRTRATPVEGGYSITGRKIWTSWARFARWSLVLARSGPVEARHRGITAFIVDLRDPGVEVRAIGQADGGDELAEVTLEEVYVPAERIIGTLDGGWAVAMNILGHERGTFAWFRHCFLQQQLTRLVDSTGERSDGERSDGELAEAILDLASVRAMSIAALHATEAGRVLGPRAAFTKLLLCSAEQELYDWILTIEADIAADPIDDSTSELRAKYLFSRIVTIYGGSQQMQLDTIAKQVLRLP